MPRGHVDPIAVANLSMCIPRRIHRQAKVKCLRSGAPSFAAWVAMVLEDAAGELSAVDHLRLRNIEIELTGLRKGPEHEDRPATENPMG